MLNGIVLYHHIYRDTALVVLIYGHYRYLKQKQNGFAEIRECQSIRLAMVTEVVC